jgi:hypothetical protein
MDDATANQFHLPPLLLMADCCCVWNKVMPPLGASDNGAAIAYLISNIASWYVCLQSYDLVLLFQPRQVQQQKDRILLFWLHDASE